MPRVNNGAADLLRMGEVKGKGCGQNERGKRQNGIM